MSRTTGCLLAACAWLGITAIARPASAQDLLEPEIPAAAELPGAVDVVPDPDDQAGNIEGWIFGQDPIGARKKLEQALTQDIQRFDRKYALTPAQRKKLELAGRQDLKRFYDRVEDAKAEFRRVNGDWNQVGNRIFPLQRQQSQPHSEIFGDESMLAKTLRKTLTPEQVARYEKTIYRARVEWMAGLLDKRLNLDARQHERLVTLVVDETPPLKRYGNFDYDAIMLQMARLPQDKLRAALDETRCRELALRFEQARRMESILVSEGYIGAASPVARAVADEHGPSAGQGESTTALGRARHGGSR
jgi:hypothetical protein